MSLRLRELKAQMEIEGETIERTEHEAVEWQNILKRWPNIRDCEANFRVCQYACDPMDVTADSVALLLDDSTPEGLAHRLSLGDPETIKREIIEKIVEHMEIDDGGFSVRNRKKLLSFWTLDKLREELRRVEAVTALQFKTTGQLREIVRQGRSAPGLPELPRKIIIHGETVKLDAARIKGLDRDSLKTLIRKWGADAVNARLREE